MRKIWLVAAALPVVAAGVAVMTPLKAADHLDGTQTGNPPDDVVRDPAADITDVFAFTPTNRQGRVAMIMNIGPLGSVSKFSDKVKYTFEVRAFNGGATLFDLNTKLDIVCQADAAGANMKCDGPNGLTKTSAIDTEGTCAVTDDICVFAGKRSDPFYFDFLAFSAADGGAPKFCTNDAGNNFFDKKNVASIVVEVNAEKLTGADATANIPILGVAASTNRLQP